MFERTGCIPLTPVSVWHNIECVRCVRPVGIFN